MNEPPAALVELWTADLDRPPLPVGELAALLDAAERERRERFRHELHRRRFAVGRGLLRHLLGRRLGVDPREVAFRYGEAGKPELASAGAPAFNLSHSHGLLLLALADRGPLGADVELLQPVRDLELMARHVLDPGELALLRGAPEAPRSRTFLAFWTAKEAFMKATGMGLGVEPREISLAMGPRGPRLTRSGDPGEDPGRWRLRSFSLPRAGAASPPAVGAVAVRAGEVRLRFRAWEAAAAPPA